MIELGQLEEHWQEFDKRKVRVVVVSTEDRKKAEATQAQFPHLIVVSDAERKLTDAVAVMDSQHPGPEGEAIASPTTFLVDGGGTVRWTFRPDRVLTRLTPAQLVDAIDKEMPAK